MQQFQSKKRGKYNKNEGPSKPAKIFYHKGIEFYFNTYTGKDKQFMNYRCRDYNCHGSLKFDSLDQFATPKVLKEHNPMCKELQKP